MFSLVISDVLDILQDYLSLDAAQKGFYNKGCKTDVHVSYSRSYKSLFYPKGRNSTPRHSWNNRFIICIERQKELYRETIF